jgi:hypothetical protein
MAQLSPLVSILDKIAQRFGMSGKLLEHRLQRQWPAIVGAHVAAHTRPESIRFKKLHVIVDSSVWVQQLTFLKVSLLQSINATAGDSPISDIVLRVGTIEPQGQADDTASSGEFSKVGPPSLPSEALAEVALHVQAIEDPDIRTHLAEVMARALASSSAPKLRP